MLRLELDQQKLTALIESKLGGTARLMDVWAARYEQLPDRTTFYSWLSTSSFTGNLRSYLQLCACLDVDPIALISPNILQSASLGDNLMMQLMNYVPDRRSRRDGRGRGIKVSDVLGLFGPILHWPAPQIVLEIYGRDWNRETFVNEGQQSSRYQPITIKTDADQWPRMIHFAYRTSSADRWRMYGSVESYQNANRLLHFYGHGQVVSAIDLGHIVVETRFGEGRCEFCLASLHDFSIEFMRDARISGVLRFAS